MFAPKERKDLRFFGQGTCPVQVPCFYVWTGAWLESLKHVRVKRYVYVFLQYYSNPQDLSSFFGCTRCFCPLIIADWGSGSTKLLWTSSDISGAAAFQSPPFAIERRRRASANTPRTFVHETTEGNTTGVRSQDLIPSFLPFVWSNASMNFIQIGTALKSMKQGEANQLLLIARAAAEILQCGTGDHAKRKLKIIAGAEEEGLCCCWFASDSPLSLLVQAALCKIPILSLFQYHQTYPNLASTYLQEHCMFISLLLWIYRWLARFWEGPLRRAWAMYILQVLRLLNHAEPTGKSVEMRRVLNPSPRSVAGLFFWPSIAWNIRWTRAVLQAAASSVGLHKKALSFCYRTLDSGSPSWRRGLRTKTEDLALYSEIFFLVGGFLCFRLCYRKRVANKEAKKSQMVIRQVTRCEAGF